MFHPHGEHKLTLSGDILTVEARGPFNLEQIDHYKTALLDELDKAVPPWGQLNILYQDCLFTPQDEKELLSTIQLRKDKGLCAIAIVFVDNKANAFAEQQLSYMYSTQQINYQCFADQEQARLWLKTQIALAKTASN